MKHIMSFLEWLVELLTGLWRVFLVTKIEILSNREVKGIKNYEPFSDFIIFPEKMNILIDIRPRNVESAIQLLRDYRVAENTDELGEFEGGNSHWVPVGDWIGVSAMNDDIGDPLGRLYDLEVEYFLFIEHLKKKQKELLKTDIPDTARLLRLYSIADPIRKILDFFRLNTEEFLEFNNSKIKKA